MRLQKRQNEILASVKLHGACSIIDLARQFEVSDETIRRNIKPLVRRGLIEKVHGGIVLCQKQEPEPPFEKRMNERVEAKQLISARVATIIRNGDSIMLDTGSTTAYVARALGEHRNLSVVTNCTEIARTLAREPSNRVHLCGGALRADDWATFGSAAIDFVRQFHVNYALLSIGGVTADGGFTDYHLEEAEFSRAVIAQAQKTIVVADHSKFGNPNFIKVCDFTEVDMVVVERAPPVDIENALREAGSVVINAGATPQD
ncbi:MAG: DeoR/GlpR family DNA-binding transcription regulator [Gammaproteobacteria bacterium]|jgi:DeoR family glycerol-3-phosphate regulon repressor|nr:DeoR/GlpR family DNA-binding transcription regulator [Gammaproteobacteria bacterium]